MTTIRFHTFVSTIAFAFAGATSCSSTHGPQPPSGGSGGGGGTAASGATAPSGGVKSSGGMTGSGGTTGVTTGRGGSTSSGGTSATGGSGVGTGWSSAKGGSGAGGVGTGGSSAKGGSGAGGVDTGGSSAKGGSGAGGVDTGGSSAKGGSGAGGAVGGAGTGGAVTAGSAAGGSTGAQTSPGCGSANPLKTSNSLTESIDGITRKWMLDVPTNYDSSKPYRLIFVWHPLGGSGSQIVSGGYNGLKPLSNSTAVFATADGLTSSNGEASGTGWWNANGGDMKLFKAMLDKINAGLCIDQTRIFSTGFSFGGMMSYTLPFEFDVFRAVAPCSGKTGVIPYTEKYTGPVAIMAFHGDSDTFVATNLGKAFFDKFAARNKCGTQTAAVSPKGCNQYQGCVVPSTWCLFPGAHTTWSEEPGAIWKFFSSF